MQPPDSFWPALAATLDPPEPVADFEAIARRRELYEETMAEILHGRGDFWPTNGWRTALDAPRFDGEQYIPVYAAVQRALASGGTDCDKWAIVMDAVAREAAKYASYVVRGHE